MTTMDQHAPAAPGAERPRERPLRRDAETNRRQILEAAGRLMAARGLAIPLEDIAAEAGVGIATLYRRFPTRDDLIAALFRDRLDAYFADMEAAVARPDGWEALVWFLEAAAARQIADRGLAELVEHDSGQAAVSQIRERMWPLATTLVERAKATGRLRPDFTVSDLALVQHMVVTVGATTHPVSDTAWRRYLTILLDGLATSRPGPTPLPEEALTTDEVDAVHAPRAAADHRGRR